MRFVIELTLLIIIFYCTWRGYKRGAVNAAISLTAVLIAVFGGLFIASTAADSASYLLRPFVAGCIDSQFESEAAANIGVSDINIEDTLASRPELVQPYMSQCLQGIGFTAKRAEHYSLRAADIYEKTELDAATASAQAGSGAIAYAVIALLFFALIMFLMYLIKQIFDLRFRITDNADVDLYGGAALGFVRGCIYCICLCWVLSFCGIIIGKTTLDDGLFSRFFLLLDTVADKIY